jgi:hypothetical protein
MGYSIELHRVISSFHRFVLEQSDPRERLASFDYGVYGDGCPPNRRVKAVKFEFRGSTSGWDSEKEELVTRAHILSYIVGLNNVTFGSVTHSPDDPKTWDFLSSHDSCWKDSVQAHVFAAYFDTAKKVSEQLREPKAPAELSTSCFFFSNQVPTVGTLTYYKDPTDSGNYNKIFVDFNGEPLPCR